MTPLKTILTTALLASNLTAFAAPTTYQPGNYSIDPANSKVGFEVLHLVISTVEGRFGKIDGKITLASDFEKSKVTASAETASVDTGVKDRDDHLRSPEFFDAKKFPQLKLVSNSIKGKPESFQMIADLTIKGITQKVTFDGKYLGTAKDAYGNEKAAFTATAKINRKDFGLTWSKVVEVGPVVGDEILIELKIQSAKVQETQKKN